MADYNRTIWKDHIKDQNGNVIQQGIPVSAKNLNNIENQLVILSAKENTLAELVRETIPSGFTTLSDLDYSYMSTNPNTIKLAADSVAFVNGYKVVIPAGTVIQLDTPPTSGSREDLVFLECWKQSDANGSVSWNYRIRVVDGIDFITYPEGISNNSNSSVYNSLAKPQGALPSPISISNTNWNSNFLSLAQRNSVVSSGWSDATKVQIASQDPGLYIAGTGSSSISAWNTADGYVYAIPMFRIHRRNSGGYSANNGNGANSYALLGSFDFTGIAANQTKQITIDSNIYSILKVGDKLVDRYYRSSYVTVVSLDGNNKISVAPSSSAYGIMYLAIMCDRPELYQYGSYNSQYQKWLYSNIVVDRDIIDFRHQVSLSGFNYQQLLEENFDKLLRGELQTSAKTQMLKTYHGIPKTPIDANHIFYASLDGNTMAEIGGNLSLGSGSFRPMPTGLGYKFNGDSSTPVAVNGINTSAGNIDCFIDFGSNPSPSVANGIICGYGNNGYRCFMLSILSTTLTFSIYDATGNVLKSITYTDNKLLSGVHHVRIRYLLNDQIYMYIDGNLVSSTTYTSAFLSVSYLFIGNGLNITPYTPVFPCKFTVSDISISNIDRGSTFATLPQDVINGYARVSQAFNDQRNVFSDALTSEIDIIQVKCAGGNGRAISLGDSTDWAKDDGTKWNNGDRIKVKGLSGEIISGVIDADTALARVIQGDGSAGSTQLYVDDVSKFSVNDTIRYYNSSNGVSGGADLTISAIDSTNKIITVNLAQVPKVGDLIFETTASTSSPKVQYYNGTNLVDVTGTWSGLGTNEATFALGTNSSLTNQDLYITYGLNEVSGQGGISEVLTTILAGESNGKKLTVNPSVHVRDDFNGKVSGSVVVSPNISKVNTANTSLLAPNLITNECTDDQYNTIKNLDGNCLNSSALASGQMSQQLFSFNIIRILEDKFGTLPCPPDIASKVAWLKANLSKVTINWWGYGTCPAGTGYAGYLDLYSSYVNNWYAKNAGRPDWCKTTKSTPSNLSQVIIATNGTQNRIENILQPDGFIHAIAYTDASDGVTPSTLYTDYINIEIVLNSGTGYDVLAPENPRRDDGKSNILLVRKETKEIATIFPRGNNDKIITYGEYVPYNGMNNTGLFIERILSMPKLIVSKVGTGNGNNIPNCRIDLLPSYSYDYYSFLSDIGNATNDISSARIKSVIEVPISSVRYNLFSSLGGSFLDYLLRYWDKSDLAMFTGSGLAYKGILNGWGSYFPIDLSSFIPANWTNCYAVLSVLVNCNDGAVRLFVIRGKLINKMFVLGKVTEGAMDYINIVNRPLIK
ncbi:hypothetical protein [Clostridium beijerinckii]|uniref:hypothetical protein n=1 Tax=Clostridium beijerinckii TaxID=1520 RepID=UPI00232DADD3|nr:hypothetical protein [Clostridium beijerinckii]